MTNRLENNRSHESNPNQKLPDIVEEKPKSIVDQLVDIASYFWRKNGLAADISESTFEFSLIIDDTRDDFGFVLVDKDDNLVAEEPRKSIVAQLSDIAYTFFGRKNGPTADVPKNNFASILGSEVVGSDEEFTAPPNLMHGPMDDDELISTL